MENKLYVKEKQLGDDCSNPGESNGGLDGEKQLGSGCVFNCDG